MSYLLLSFIYHKYNDPDAGRRLTSSNGQAPDGSTKLTDVQFPCLLHHWLLTPIWAEAWPTPARFHLRRPLTHILELWPTFNWSWPRTAPADTWICIWGVPACTNYKLLCCLQSLLFIMAQVTLYCIHAATVTSLVYYNEHLRSI